MFFFLLIGLSVLLWSRHCAALFCMVSLQIELCFSRLCAHRCLIDCFAEVFDWLFMPYGFVVCPDFPRTSQKHGHDGILHTLQYVHTCRLVCCARHCFKMILSHVWVMFTICSRLFFVQCLAMIATCCNTFSFYVWLCFHSIAGCGSRWVASLWEGHCEKVMIPWSGEIRREVSSHFEA